MTKRKTPAADFGSEKRKDIFPIKEEHLNAPVSYLSDSSTFRVKKSVIFEQ